MVDNRIVVAGLALAMTSVGMALMFFLYVERPLKVKIEQNPVPNVITGMEFKKVASGE